MFTAKHTIEGFDPDLWRALEAESRRQEDHIELIASENYASRRCWRRRARCSPTRVRRRLSGQALLRRLRACGRGRATGHRPGQGAVQGGLCQRPAALRRSGQRPGVHGDALPGDTILGMSLAHGGHLTHGGERQLLRQAVQVGGLRAASETEAIDYDQVEKLAHEHRPKMIVAGASAYALVIDWKRFREIADAVEAYLMVDMAHYAGLIAAGVYPSPIAHAHFTTSTTHKTLRGPRGGLILSAAEFEKPLNSMIFPGIQGGPLMHVIIAAKAVAFKRSRASSSATRSRSLPTRGCWPRCCRSAACASSAGAPTAI